jgi:cell division protein FtsZ
MNLVNVIQNCVGGATIGADMVFIAGGMGGGTGTGAAPIVAQTAKELGALTVAVVTRPFTFEGAQRNRLADQGLEELRKQVDAMIVIPNDRILATVAKDTLAKTGFAMSDDILRQAVEGISDLITTPGTINVDFADIRSVMENAGSALMGIGTASGDNRAVEAAKGAINSPLLDISIHNAKGVLFAVAGGDDLTMLEIQEAAKVITESIDPNARVIFGTIFDEKLKKNEIKVTVIATGFPDPSNLTRDSLFPVRGASKAPEEERRLGGIFGGTSNSTPTIKEKVEEKKNEPVVTATPQPTDVKDTKPLPDEDSDDWGAVPAFLRRNKK